MNKKYSSVKGFNYHPSYAYNSYETWRFFDPQIIEKEIKLAKQYFPKINTMRIWLSYDAFRYEEDRQAKNFESMLSILDKYDLKAIACLFNCWHDDVMDNGGIYHPQMIPGSIWCSTSHMYDSFIKKIVGAHKNDDRVLIWDICNEPYSYGDNEKYRQFMEPYETQWLKKMIDLCHSVGAVQPCGISHYSKDLDPRLFEETAAFSDVLLIHPYYYYSDEDVRKLPKEGFEKLLQQYKDIAEKYQKPLLTTETCWGSRDNKVRAEIIKNTLEAHNKAEIGFIAHALHWSHVADLHDDSEGPLSFPGNLMFITKDEKIREYHEVFNQY